MSFDLPNLNKPQNKAEKESVTNAFLREQIRLPEEKWSPEFRKLVDDEARESVLFMERRQRIGNGEEVEVEESPDAKYVQKKHFEEALNKVRPSVTKSTFEVYKKMEENFIKSARVSIPSGGSYLG